MACNFPASQVVVVGGGLAGVSAANTVLENGGRIVLLDKSAFCGGNSTKATSGINGSNTKTQRAQGIEDSNELFVNDTIKGGAKKPELVKVLCNNSGPDCEWLMDEFALDLSLVARLGGHSAPRTHRGKERFPGMTITYALIQMVEKIAEKTDLARVITKARAHKLLQNPAGDVVGLCYERNGEQFQEHGPVILCSGGFGADFTNDSLLAKFRPDLMHLPTSNGEHCTGDGIKMGESIGANSLDLEWVQVHPTGLVKPDDEDAKVKFLAAEALRGVGGLVLDANGQRFCNELGRRDYVTGEMWKNKGPFRLVLNEAAAKEIHWHCEHYKGRGVMQKFDSGKALAQAIGCPLKTLEDVHEAHYQVSLKMAKDPEGGPFPAYPSGKSWDEPSGKTGCGKKFFHNVIPGSAVANQVFHVAFITPIIHYCMGGLEINEKSEVLKKDGKVIRGLYAAGEVAGGVHGNNRLGGNSLLDCVVFGRVAGAAAAKYTMGDRVKKVKLSDLAGGIPGAAPAVVPGSYEDQSKVKAVAAAAAAAPVASGYSMEEVAKHTTKDDCWVVLNGRVLDVTKFLPDHPGGELAILTFAGKDATAEFDMIHPPDVIEKYAADCVIGVLGAAGEPSAAPAVAAGLTAPLLAKGDAMANEHAWGQWREELHNNPSAIGVPIYGWFRALYLMVYAFLAEILLTIFSTNNIKITNERTGLTRSAMFLLFFIVIHALGNLHLFLGPDDFNGYGYFYVRLYWTGFGLSANIVEEYVALAAILHVVVGLKRTWDISLNYTINSGKLNLAISGVFLLVFMIIHLQQFRFGEAEGYKIRPQWMWPFYTDDVNTAPVEVRDIYKLEMDLFQNAWWCAYYLISVLVFLFHAIIGWGKVVTAPALGIPRLHQKNAGTLGNVLIVFIGLCYLSFPVYCFFGAPGKAGAFGQY